MVNFLCEENEEILTQFATKAYNKWVRNTKLEEKEKLSLFYLRVILYYKSYFLGANQQPMEQSGEETKQKN